MPRTGRPTKLTEETIQVICAALTQGNYITDACAVAGVTKDTFYAWSHLAETARQKQKSGGRLTKQEDLALDFSDSTQLAIQQGAAMMLDRIHRSATETSVERRVTRKIIGTRRVEYGQASDGTPLFEDQPIMGEEISEIIRPPDPKADMWRLARRFPGWQERQALEVSGPEGGPIPIEARAAEASERLRQLQDRRLKALPAVSTDETPPPAAGGETP